MGCEADIVCAEPARKKLEPAITTMKTPAVDGARDLVKANDKRPVDGVGAESEEAKQHRAEMIERHKDVVALGFDTFGDAVHRSMTMIAVPEEAKKSSSWGELLGVAVGAILAGTSGAIGAWVARSIVHRIGNKFVSDVVKDAVSKTLKPSASSSPPSKSDLKEAFLDSLHDEIRLAKVRHIREWPQVASRLRQTSITDLEKLDLDGIEKAASSELPAELVQQILVGWTNFLARVVHGGMGAWDPWQRHGREKHPTLDGQAIPLRGAAKNPYETPQADRVDPMLNNVDPKNMYWAVDKDQRPTEGEHVGILEIHLWSDGALNIRSEYGMRLDNVGPRVRQAFKNSGKSVRELPINKIVRVSHDGASQLNPPRADGAFLISADGHIRLTSWTLGRERLVPFAERAQDLPLSALTE